MLGDLACRVLMRMAGQIVPPGERAGWHGHWRSCLSDLQTLVERGEFPRDNSMELRWVCAASLADAFRTRSVTFQPEDWLRRPAIVPAALSFLLMTLVAVTHSFGVTRSLIAAGAEKVLPYALVVVFALFVSFIIAVRCRARLSGHDWRYWSFLLLKTGALVAILSLVWIEGGYLLRRNLSNDTVRALGGGFLLTLVYLASVGSSVLWSMGDQQRRCPVCLRLMASPVRIGSWASVFEPVTTELLCPEGHGSLCLQECEMGEPDRWLSSQFISS